ncbi:MAG: DUF2922 domain-containing protein [Bacilli bacterium]
MMTTVLELEFVTIGNRPFRLSIPNPKTGLTDVELATFGNGVVTANVFVTSTGELRDFVSAKYVNTEETIVVQDK